MRILIAEDEAGAAHAMAAYLELRGHTVAVAIDGPAALSVAERTPPDALIADWRLGHEMDGVTVARELQQRQPALPAILISAYSTEELRNAAKGLSNVRILSKPVQLAELARLVEATAAP